MHKRITQTITLSVEYDLEFPDDWSDDDMDEYVNDYPMSVVVKPQDEDDEVGFVNGPILWSAENGDATIEDVE